MELAPLAYATIRQKALSFLRGRGVSTQDARDLIQEAFARLLQSSTCVERPQIFVMVAARNLWIDEVRRRRVGVRALTRTTLEALYGETCDSRDAFRLCSGDESVHSLLASLDKMTPRRREIWRRVRLLDEPLKTVAEHYGLSVKTVEKALRIADRQLAAAPDYDDWGCQGSDTHLSLDGSCRIQSELIESS